MLLRIARFLTAKQALDGATASAAVFALAKSLAQFEGAPGNPDGMKA